MVHHQHGQVRSSPQISHLLSPACTSSQTLLKSCREMSPWQHMWWMGDICCLWDEQKQSRGRHHILHAPVQLVSNAGIVQNYNRQAHWCSVCKAGGATKCQRAGGHVVLATQALCHPCALFLSSCSLRPGSVILNKTLTYNWALTAKFLIWVSLFYTLLKVLFGVKLPFSCSLGNMVVRVIIIQLLLYENVKTAMNLMRLLSVSKLIMLQKLHR